MDSDTDPDLKAAFGELHRRQRDAAPPFGSMRERAIRQAEKPERQAARIPLAWRVATVSAVIFVAAAMIRWGIGNREPGSPNVDPYSTERVDTLLTAIEQHLEQSETMPLPEYPTDVLLAGNDYDLPQ